MGAASHVPKPWPGATLPTTSHTDDPFTGHMAEAWITSRQNISPKRLEAPGPDVSQLQQIFRSAASAPDHGLVKPWRFVIVPQDKRALLAEVFALALVDRDPGATLEQIETAREKAHRAPVLMLVVARLGNCEPPTPALERMVSVGAADDSTSVTLITAWPALPSLTLVSPMLTQASSALAPVQQDILWAEHLLFFFPLWMGDMPALTKAFIEQVARPGFAVGPDDARPFGHKPLSGRSARVVVTMGMPALVYRWFYRANSLKALERNVLGFIGYGPIHETLIGQVDTLGEAGVSTWLKRLRRLGRQGD